MAVLKCKMCGGNVIIEEETKLGVCESCGTRQTVPSFEDEEKNRMYNRANHFRRNGEFDKALKIYEQILEKDDTDAESYWSIVLCEYGIEYVEDALTKKRIPTVNRMRSTSIFNDENYKAAIEKADYKQKQIYQEEAAVIDKIQKEIMQIAEKEKPYDVFICYKETDSQGNRTEDSVIGLDLFKELIRSGLKVFFARVTLEKMLGEKYEPYIFAALNSSKVMIVLGTKPEYFEAPWVRNEWSRFLTRIKNGENKYLIPAYKNMSAYDLPSEFSNLQAQDMNKLGFMQDLVFGVKKLVGKKHSASDKNGAVKKIDTESLLKRVFIFLEDGDWKNAGLYCEKVLDAEPENGKAYLGKLMMETKTRRIDDLGDLRTSFSENNNYKRAVKYTDKALSEKIQRCAEKASTRARKRIEAEKLEREKKALLAKEEQERKLQECEARQKAAVAELKMQKAKNALSWLCNSLVVLLFVYLVYVVDDIFLLSFYHPSQVIQFAIMWACACVLMYAIDYVLSGLQSDSAVKITTGFSVGIGVVACLFVWRLDLASMFNWINRISVAIGRGIIIGFIYMVGAMIINYISIHIISIVFKDR